MNLDSVKVEPKDPLIYRKLAATHVDILSEFCEVFLLEISCLEAAPT